MPGRRTTTDRLADLEARLAGGPPDELEGPATVAGAMAAMAQTIGILGRALADAIDLARDLSEPQDEDPSGVADMAASLLADPAKVQGILAALRPKTKDGAP